MFLLLIVFCCTIFYEVVFYFDKNWGCLHLKKNKVVFRFKNIIVFTFNCFWLHYFLWGHLPFSKKFRLSSFKKKVRSSFTQLPDQVDSWYQRHLTKELIYACENFIFFWEVFNKSCPFYLCLDSPISFHLFVFAGNHLSFWVPL